MNPSLALKIEWTVATYYIAKTDGPNNDATPINLTSRFRLLVTPVGSTEFTEEFFMRQVAKVCHNTTSLGTSVPNLHTRLQIFVQCTIQKLPHLLGANIMHRLPLDWDACHWQEWSGPLTVAINEIIHNFLDKLIGRESLPEYALLVYQLSVGMGRICILYPSHREDPDFVFIMAAAIYYAGQGICFNKDLKPFHFHPLFLTYFFWQ